MAIQGTPPPGAIEVAMASLGDDPRPWKLESSVGNKADYADCFTGRMALWSDAAVILELHPEATVTIRLNERLA